MPGFNFPKFVCEIRHACHVCSDAGFGLSGNAAGYTSHTHPHTHTQTCTHTYTHMHTHAHAHAHANAHAHAHAHANAHAYAYAHAHAHAHAQTQAHTRILRCTSVTRYRNCEFSSGAPPVRSKVVIDGVFSINCCNPNKKEKTNNTSQVVSNYIVQTPFPTSPPWRLPWSV